MAHPWCRVFQELDGVNVGPLGFFDIFGVAVIIIIIITIIDKPFRQPCNSKAIQAAGTGDG